MLVDHSLKKQLRNLILQNIKESHTPFWITRYLLYSVIVLLTFLFS